MTRIDVTHAQLDRTLRSLGFTRRSVAKAPPAVRYEHEETGARISMPPFDEGQKVADYHLAIARAVLETFDIADALAFGAELQKAKSDSDCRTESRRSSAGPPAARR